MLSSPAAGRNAAAAIEQDITANPLRGKDET
jgi:hypothetical protein